MATVPRPRCGIQIALAKSFDLPHLKSGEVIGSGSGRVCRDVMVLFYGAKSRDHSHKLP